MQQYAIIDVETTGGNLETEKITEIACYIFDGKNITERFSTLINPERSIPQFISTLTGITDDMVQSAPKFYEVAEQLVKLTEGKIFVAHNSLFDYRFVRKEFASLGFTYERDTLCTCKFSKKIIPGRTSYSLANICRDLGIVNTHAHRAESDVAATVQLFRYLLGHCLPEQLLLAIKPHTEPDLAEFLSSDLIKKLPEKTGLYYFLDKEKNIIYIGKSNNIKKRVTAHFRNKSAGKTARMRQLINDIHFELTGNELIALLLESFEIKKHQPLFNRAQKQKDFKFGIFNRPDDKGYANLIIDKIIIPAPAIPLFKSYEEAEKILYRKMKQFNLCPALCSLEKRKSSFCFNYQLKQCNGACGGLESNADYNMRVNTALGTFKYDLPDFIIVDKGKSTEEKSVILVEDGRFKGFGFFDSGESWNNLEEIKNNLRYVEENPDIHAILLSRLKAKKYEKLVILKTQVNEEVIN